MNLGLPRPSTAVNSVSYIVATISHYLFWHIQQTIHLTGKLSSQPSHASLTLDFDLSERQKKTTDCPTIFLLIDSPRLALDERPLSQTFNTYVKKFYPDMTPRHDGKTFPLILDIKGDPLTESKGTFLYNPHHIAAGINEIIRFLEQEIGVNSGMIGIAIL